MEDIEILQHHPSAHLDAYSEQVELPNGKVFDEFYHLHFDPVVCIVAETEDGQAIMERQYRHAVKEILTEIPAGIVEKGEDPLEAAQRELLEETGFGGGQWTAHWAQSMRKAACRTTRCTVSMPKA